MLLTGGLHAGLPALLDETIRCPRLASQALTAAIEQARVDFERADLVRQLRRLLLGPGYRGSDPSVETLASQPAG